MSCHVLLDYFSVQPTLDSLQVMDQIPIARAIYSFGAPTPTDGSSKNM